MMCLPRPWVHGCWVVLLLSSLLVACGSDGSSGSTGTTSGAGGGVFMCDSTGIDITKEDPPVVTIMEPMDGSSYTASAQVPLSGAAHDKFDGNITSPLQMRWAHDYVNPDGEGPMDHIDAN